MFYPKSFSRASKKNTRVGTGRKRRFGAARFGTGTCKQGGTK